MADALLGWINRVTTGTLTAGSEAALMPVSNLKTQHGSADQGWQTQSGVDTTGEGAWFQIDAGAEVPWRAFGLFRTNFTTNASVRWRIGNDPAWGSWVYSSTLISTGVVPGFAQSLHVLQADMTARYCRCDLNDPGNPDGFLNVPLAYAGPAVSPAFNFDYPSTFSIDDATDEVVTRGGAEYPEHRFTRRRWAVAYETIAQADLWATVMAWYRAGFGGGNVLFIPNPASADMNREAIFGRVKAASDVTYPFDNEEYRAWRATVTERL